VKFREYFTCSALNSVMKNPLIYVIIEIYKE